MIQKTTNLGSDYVSFFKDIKDFSDGDIDIARIEEFYANIKEIAALENGQGMKFLRLPLDEPLFEINANTRAITVPPEFKANGISVSGDHLAEIVFFCIDRYFDVIDFANEVAVIKWKIGSVQGESDCFIQSTDILPGHIIFGWPIAKDLTGKSGQLSFAVEFRNEENKPEYSFNTLVANVNIKEGLTLVDPITVSVESDILSMLQDSSFGEGDAAVADPSWTTGLTSTGLYKGLVADLDSNEFVPVINLENEITVEGPKSKAATLYANASSGADAEMKYYFGEYDLDCEMIAVDSETLQDNMIYYVSAGSNVYDVATDDDKNAYGTDSEVPLFIKVAKLVVDKPGTYAVSAQGVKFSGDKKIGASISVTSDFITIPEPQAVEVEVTKAEVELEDGYSIDENVAKTTVYLVNGSAGLVAKVKDEDIGLIKFDWQKADENGEFSAINPSAGFGAVSENTLTANAEGEYKVLVNHFKNNASLEEDIESDVYTVANLAGKFEDDSVALRGNALNNMQVNLKSTPVSIYVDYDLAASTAAYSEGINLELELGSELAPVSSEEDSVELPTVWTPVVNDGTAKVVFADNSVASVDAKKSCKLYNTLDEGYYRIKISNNYKGSIYTAYTDIFYANK